MKSVVGSIAAIVFTVATLGAMVHAFLMVASTATFAGLLTWLATTGVAALLMALTDTPMPAWESDYG